MRGVHFDDVHLHSGTYVERTRVRELHLADHVTADLAVTLAEFLRYSAQAGEGTAEFHAWLDRTARRVGLGG